MGGKGIFIAMAAGSWPECSWRGAEGGHFLAPPSPVGVVELLRSPQGTKDVSAHEMAA
jgi:hypothetical protein